MSSYCSNHPLQVFHHNSLASCFCFCYCFGLLCKNSLGLGGGLNLKMANYCFHSKLIWLLGALSFFFFLNVNMIKVDFISVIFEFKAKVFQIIID